MLMKKIVIIFLITLLLLTGCHPRPQTLEEVADKTDTDVSNEESLITGKTTYPTMESATTKTVPIQQSDITKKTTYPTRKSAMTKTNQIQQSDQIVGLHSTEKVAQLITKSVLQEEMMKFVYFGGSDNFNIMLNHYDTKFSVECIRMFEDDNFAPYCIFRLEEGGYLYVFFHGGDLWFTDYAFFVKEPLTYKDFDKVQTGSKLEIVEQIDEGFSSYLRTNSVPFGGLAKSVHLVEDGFVVLDYKLTEGEWSSISFESTEWLKNVVVKSKKFIPNGQVVLDYSKQLGHKKVRSYKLLEQDLPKNLF